MRRPAGRLTTDARGVELRLPRYDPHALGSTEHVDVRPGRVLTFGPAEWCYSYGESLILDVTAARHDLSRYYGGAWLWLTGYRLDEAGVRGELAHALVKVTALQRQLPGPPPSHRL